MITGALFIIGCIALYALIGLVLAWDAERWLRKHDPRSELEYMAKKKRK